MTVDGAAPDPLAQSPKNDESTDQTPELCALEGCDLPLPARLLDDQGRAKGGRRARYCSKAHTDAASRQRRARDIASVDDPLTLAQIAGETFLPTARQLAGQLTDLIARFDQAEAGALARVSAAEHEAAQAVADAAEAHAAGEAAEQARRQALQQSRLDQQAGAAAIRQAEQARTDADQIRTAAWEQVATHERARGQAEAARTAAQQVAEDLVSENRRLAEVIDHARAITTDLTARLADRQSELERLRGENLALAVRTEAVERLTAQTTAHLQHQVADLEAHTAQLRADLATQAQAQPRADQPSRGARRTPAHRRIAGAGRGSVSASAAAQGPGE